jgi:uncharacterized protein YcaQ
MGFVQIDSINVVERSHHHILQTRFDGYRPALLTRLLERDRRLFEHWTHDAAAIPTVWLPHWKPRFRDFRKWRPRWSRRLGPDPSKTLAHVRRRIRNEGPLKSADFEDPRTTRTGWWDWKPAKAGLEYLWRTGELAVARRDSFHKVYDLVERVLPESRDLRAPTPAEHLDWACRSALERLGAATPREIRSYFYRHAEMEVKPFAAWCERAERRGEIEAVAVESANGSPPRPSYALADWRKRAARVPDAPKRIRLLSPFDPLMRDRERAQRLFDFDYTFEAYVPAPKRRFGYYVLPLLEGERLVGRVDAKLHRADEQLEIRGLWWEPGVKATATRRRALERAVGLFSEQLGATSYQLPR